jgi:hypothetical protein
VEFRVDTGSDVTTLSVAKARELGLSVPRKAIEFNVEAATGQVRQVRHPGRIQGKVFGLDGWDFDWPCHFVEHQGPGPKPLLGLAGVLDDLRIGLDGSYSLESPYGWLHLERRE